MRIKLTPRTITYVLCPVENNIITMDLFKLCNLDKYKSTVERECMFNCTYIYIQDTSLITKLNDKKVTSVKDLKPSELVLIFA